MQAHDRRAFLEVVIGFAELKGKQLSAPALELFWNSMQDWTIEEFRTAANILVRTAEFMPTPKDFHDLRKAAHPTAGEAWAAVLRYLPWSGSYLPGDETPKPDGLTPEVEKAVRALGGYRALAMMPSKELTWMERRFADHYADILDAKDRRGEPPPALPANIVKLLSAK
jgi:hypothetical protein